MTNPIVIAIKGKGIVPMLTRGSAIASRYSWSPKKIDLALSAFTGILQNFGCRATLPVTASALERNSAFARHYPVERLELAIHGLMHVDYTQYSLEAQINHFSRAQRIFEQLGVRATGFRCPYLRWNEDTLTALLECGIAYDSSQSLSWDIPAGLATDTYWHALEFYGAQPASKYPALPRLTRGMVRIPYCLPDDEALVERLKIGTGQGMAELWLAMLDRIYRDGELFTLGLHPERIFECREALIAVLTKARSLSPSVWIATLDEVAAWYRAMEGVNFTQTPLGTDCLHVEIFAPEPAVVLIRSIEVDIPTQCWGQNYRVVPAKEFNLRSPKRPFIGLAPECDPSLAEFLRHQGYLIEINADPQPYTIYLRHPHLGLEDEGPLLREIEGCDGPILRIARWPDAAQCALAITGDVDAFTLWDYGRRFWNR
jgi:hypothetical protein